MVSQKKRTLLFLASILEVQCFFSVFMFGGHEAIKVETKSFLGSWLVPGAGADHSWHKEGFKAWRGDLLQLTRHFFCFWSRKMG